MRIYVTTATYRNRFPDVQRYVCDVELDRIGASHVRQAYRDILRTMTRAGLSRRSAGLDARRLLLAPFQAQEVSR